MCRCGEKRSGRHARCLGRSCRRSGTICRISNWPNAVKDRTSFRQFCRFAPTEATPERPAFVRFRRELVRQVLDQVLFEEILAQLRFRVVRVKTGTLMDASVVGSASRDDVEIGWAGHSCRKAVRGYKVHVGADAETALVEELAVTPGNIHEGKHGASVLLADPGGVYADSAYLVPDSQSRCGRRAAHLGSRA